MIQEKFPEMYNFQKNYIYVCLLCAFFHTLLLPYGVKNVYAGNLEIFSDAFIA